MSTYDNVKKRLLALCDQKGININKLAELSALAPSTVKNILYGKSKNPGTRTLLDICQALGITLYDFFNDELFKDNTIEGTY